VTLSAARREWGLTTRSLGSGAVAVVVAVVGAVVAMMK
jgi:hypothetical protein